ncbi:MAG TPA: FkbM family methyltransferase [Rhabdochlamydiaceae bacterium]|nr:FkbM family methyltransferase [Rhabdochlamydiaceae bacterium]
MKRFLKPGNLVFDIGGNCGEWSQYALKTEPSVQIMAFEPVPSVFERFRTLMQSQNNIRIFNYALSDQKGEAAFHYYLEADALSGFYYREVLRGELAEPQLILVQQETLDDFCAGNEISKIDFIKIDTEGAEWRILQGAKNLLKNHQIRAVQFEYGGCYIDAKTSLKQVIRFLTDNHYVVFRIIPSGLIHIAVWKGSLENFDLSNYFAICKEDMPGYELVRFK